MTKRWLPDHVTAYRDRHGKARYRFRKAGQRIVAVAGRKGA